MKTVLRVISRSPGGSKFIEIPNPYNMAPRKNDSFVWEQTCYTVSYVEFDFDTSTLYIITHIM